MGRKVGALSQANDQEAARDKGHDRRVKAGGIGRTG
jgi:hypothetical protein